jgi:hypothetical protein
MSEMIEQEQTCSYCRKTFKFSVSRLSRVNFMFESYKREHELPPNANFRDFFNVGCPSCTIMCDDFFYAHEEEDSIG